MSTLNFPTSPSLNDTYSFGTKTWIWNGSAWQLNRTGAINDIPVGNITPASGAFTTLTANSTITAVGNITGGNLSGTSIVGTLTTAAQTNITSVGTLTALSVTGNVTGGNIGIGTANISAPLTVAFTSGTPIANLMTTDAAIITANATAPGFAFVVAGSSSGHRGVFKGTRARGTLESPEVPQQNDAVITMLGAIYDGATTRATAGIEFTVDGTVSAGVAPQRIALLTGETNSRTERMSIYGNGVVNVRTTTSSTSSDSGALIVSGGAGIAGNINASGSLSVTGNITGGNVSAATGAFITVTGNANATSLTSGTVPSARLSGSYTINISGTATSATTAGTVTTAAQPNITSVGTLSSLSVTGNVTSGNLITAGLVSLSSITKTGSNGVGNIGAAASTFNTVFAKATSAQYADVAECYQADCDYAPGTVLIIGGSHEVTASTVSHDHRAAGVVSENPSYLMNAALDTLNSVAVALLGRVPCQVVGPIDRGDLLTTSTVPGTAGRLDPAKYLPGCVIGKALQDYHSEQPGTIEIAVGVK